MRCDACSAENAPGTTFCNSCGNYLGWTDGPVPDARAEPEATDARAAFTPPSAAVPAVVTTPEPEPAPALQDPSPATEQPASPTLRAPSPGAASIAAPPPLAPMPGPDPAATARLAPPPPPVPPGAGRPMIAPRPAPTPAGTDAQPPVAPPPAARSEAPRLVIPERTRPQQPPATVGMTVPSPVSPAAASIAPATPAVHPPSAYPADGAPTLSAASAAAEAQRVFCPSCGRPNEAHRRLCEVCGSRLDGADLRGAKADPTYPVAGTRPVRKRRRWGRFVAMVVVLALAGGAALPQTRRWISSHVRTAKTKVTSKPLQVKPSRVLTQATSEAAGHPATNAIDNVIETSWLPDTADPAPRINVKFDEAFDLAVIFIYSGKQDKPVDFDANAHPKVLTLHFVLQSGQTSDQRIGLADTFKPQQFTAGLAGVVEVDVTIDSCYVDVKTPACSVAELEFQKKG